MASVRSLYGALTTITCTLTSLAAGAARQSSLVDNSSDMGLDAQLALQIAVIAGVPSGAALLNVWGYRSVDGSHFDDPATGVDGAITITQPSNLVLLDQIIVLAGNKTYSRQIASVAQKFGGVLPIKWGIAIDNQCGLALNSSGHTLQYRTLMAQTQ